MNRYTFEKITKRMGDQFGTLRRGQEEAYTYMFFAIESNALKVHRANPRANSRSFREALLLALHSIDMRVNGRQEDLSAFETPENKALSHAVLYAFDPFTCEEVEALMRENVAAASGGTFTDYPEGYLRDYYTVPVKCIIRLVDSVDTWIKALGSDGYFKYIEDSMGAEIKDDDELHFIYRGSGKSN